jgi:CheY-like chemotaxis protein
MSRARNDSLYRLLGADGDAGVPRGEGRLSLHPVMDTEAELRGLRDRPPSTVIVCDMEEDTAAIEFLREVANGCPQPVRILASPKPVDSGASAAAASTEVAAGIVQLPWLRAGVGTKAQGAAGADVGSDADQQAGARAAIWEQAMTWPTIPPLRIPPPPGLEQSRPACWLCDDDADYRFLVDEAWRAAHPLLPLHTFSKGSLVLDALDSPTTSEYPALLLLDLNLPGKSGLDILAELRRDSARPAPRICVFTSSTTHTNIHEAFARGADGYFVKPLSFEKMKAQMSVLGHLWLAN